MPGIEKASGNINKRVSGDLSKEDFALPQKFIGNHTVAEGETLSGIAQEFYGHSTREHWMVIYNVNKAKIGADPGKLKPGTELRIPELPDNLK